MDITRDTMNDVYRMQRQRTKAYDEDNKLDPDNIKDKIRSKMNNVGYSRLGSGDYRVVYGSEDHVVKFAWTNRGTQENRDEVTNWRHINGLQMSRIDGDGECKVREYLAHIIDQDVENFGWILMERVDTGADNVTIDEANRLNESLSAIGVNINEIKPYNMGRTYRESFDKKVPVVFDYAGT